MTCGDVEGSGVLEFDAVLNVIQVPVFRRCL